MTFTPHNSNHAVQSTVFAVFFEGTPLGRPIEKEDFSKDSKALAQLPGTRPFQSFAIKVGEGKASSGPLNVGTEFFLSEPDGTPAWLLRIAPDHILVECRVYTRWKNVWGKAQVYILEALAALEETSDSEPLIARIEMNVMDRFTAPSPDYDIRTLLKPSKYLPDFLSDVGAAWHSHVGWFASGPSKTLNNLNCDAKPVVEKKPDGDWQIQILHFQRRTYDGPAEEKDSESELKVVFESFHQANKELIQSILADKVCADIGLSGGNKK